MKIRDWVLKLNTGFVKLFLAFLYLVIFAVVAVPARMVGLLTRKKEGSYWRGGHKIEEEDFKSAY